MGWVLRRASGCCVLWHHVPLPSLSRLVPVHSSNRALFTLDTNLTLTIMIWVFDLCPSYRYLLLDQMTTSNAECNSVVSRSHSSKCGWQGPRNLLCVPRQFCVVGLVTSRVRFLFLEGSAWHKMKSKDYVGVTDSPHTTDFSLWHPWVVWTTNTHPQRTRIFL